MKNTLISSAALGLALLAASPSDAATVSWGTPTTITGQSDVSLAGSLLYAYNLGGSGVQAATLNTVLFLAFPLGTGISGTQSNLSVSLSVPAGTFFNASPSFSSNDPYSSIAGVILNRMLSTGVNPNTPTNSVTAPMTLTLLGLTLGQSYQVQLWACDTTGGATTAFGSLADNAKTILTAGNVATLDVNTTDANGGVGQWVLGSFTADATSQDITVTASSNGTGSLPYLNGLQVRAVPEPASTTLLLSSLGLLAGQRRRVKKK